MLGLDAHVMFAGHVTDAQLLAYYQCADLFLCLSEHEGFCVPLIEAMSAGVPVLAFASTGVPYTLGAAGVLLREKRWDVLAGLCSTILSDSELRSALVMQQRARARDFAPGAVRAQFEHYLATLGL